MHNNLNVCNSESQWELRVVFVQVAKHNLLFKKVKKSPFSTLKKKVSTPSVKGKEFIEGKVGSQRSGQALNSQA